MSTISSPWTSLIKKGTPLLLFIGLPSLLFLEKDEDFGATGYLLLAILFGIGFVTWQLFVMTLADEVEDHGDWLLVRRGGEEEKVPLTNIMSVRESIAADSQRIVLRLARSGKFGREIAFVPTWSGSLFGRHPVAEDLMARVDQVRTQRATAKNVPT